MKKVIIILYAIIISLLYCSSYNSNSEKWEGISGSRLKIVIAEFFPFEENVMNNKIEAIVKQRADSRASLIMASYISINLSRDKISPANDVALNNLINESVSTGKLTDYHCSENNYCNASAEYDITALLKKLEAINNQ